MQPRDFDRITQAIYAGVADDTAFEQALQLLAASHSCRSSAFIYTDRVLPGANVQMTFGPFSSAEVRARYLAYADEDPAPRAMARLAIGEAAATDRLFSTEALAHSRFLQEFYRPLGLEEALGGPVSRGDAQVGIVAVHRGRDRDAFSTEEIADFGRLLPHFAQALTLRRTFFKASQQQAALAGALDTAAAGIMTFDPDGVVTHANAKARALLARNDGLSLTRAGKLQVADAATGSRLRLAMATAGGPPSASILRVPRQPDQQPYRVRIERRLPTLDFRGSFVLYISDPDLVADGTAEAVQAAFGLSRQSAHLVATLVSGGDIASYAANAGISRNTAKYHLQAAFVATGTTRQVDLVSHAAGVLRDLGTLGMD